MTSLSDFSKKITRVRRGPACWACTIPETEEINQGRRNGVMITTIRDWLIEEKGYDPTEANMSRLGRHFSLNRHHEK